ncbi:MAG: queuosine salvage family protein [Nanoarchaeota archaeon]|nr:queuosine salvage family protein [Nanoarchaeota archaeon]
MKGVLKTTKQVVDESWDVCINRDAIQRVCSDLVLKDTPFWLDGTPFLKPELSDIDKLNLMFTMGALNFCYWGEPKWTVEYNGKQLDGAWAMIASFYRAVEEGKPIFNSSYLENIIEQEVGDILRGQPQIPLFNERVSILRETGAGLNKKYQGEFVNLLESASHDALKLLDLITENFPSYDDFANYNGAKVEFHKRAQLVISGIYGAFHGQGFGNFRNVHELTACADYKIPQTLRKSRILEYSEDLAHKVDTKQEIPASSREEVEIRANQLWAIEYMKDALQKRIPGIRSIDLDSWLWLQGQNKSPDDKPYHRTRTIYY